MLSKIKTFFMYLGIILSGIATWFLFSLGKISKKTDTTGKGNQIREKMKQKERERDMRKSKEAREDIEKKIEKKKEALNAKDISDLTDRFNAEFGS